MGLGIGSLQSCGHVTRHSFFALGAALVLLFLPGAATALTDRLTFGIELTANTDGNPEYDIGKPVAGELIPFVELAAKRFAELTGGTVLERKASGEIPVKNQYGTWHFENDGGVLEVASPVLRLSEMNALEPAFAAFADVGLKPQVLPGGREGGGGHIHIGRNIFDENPLLLRNLLVDIANKPFIQGVLEETGEDQALSLRDRRLLPRFKAELDQLDHRFARGEAVSAEDVARSFVRAFGDGTDLRVPRGDEIYSWSARFSDINVTNLLTELHPTVEIRLMRAPADWARARNRAEFFARYLTELSKHAEPLPLALPSPAEEERSQLPTIMRQNWLALIDQLGLSREIFSLEWKDKFTPLLTRQFREDGTNRVLQIREGRSRPDWAGIYELKVTDFEPPVWARLEAPQIEVRIGSKTMQPVFHQISRNTWLASLIVPEAVSPWANGIRGFKFNLKPREPDRNISPRTTLWLPGARLTGCEQFFLLQR